MSAKLFHNISVSQVKDSFQALEKKEKTSFTAQEIIKMNSAEISNALDKGYTFNEISQLVFKPNGCNISGALIQKEFSQLHGTKKRKVSKKLAISE